MTDHPSCPHKLRRYELVKGDRRNNKGMVVSAPTRNYYLSVDESCIGVWGHEGKEHIDESSRRWVAN